jgi:citrate lyase subunit beta/citryl-CoA lyase
MRKISETGRKETASDCWVRLEIKEKGDIAVDLKSKVMSMYGSSIQDTVKDMMKFFNIDNAAIEIDDGGSLPFVLTARIEAAVKNAFPKNEKQYLPPLSSQSSYTVKRDRFRRSRLYLPGDQPRLIINAGLYGPDGIILDLEDAVAPSEKESARFIVRNALREVNFFGAEKMVRINPLPEGLKDLDMTVPHGVHTILIPKCENADSVKEVDSYILKLRKENSIENEIFLMPILESALGIIKAYEIAKASENNVALTIGLEDFTADIGVARTSEGRESYLARQETILAAKAAGIQAIDSVFSDVADEEGLKKSILEAKSMGFEGKGCIHPGQIRIVHEGFAPTAEEIERAKKIYLALEKAQKKGSGVVALGNKMIDPPVVKRAEKVLELAVQNNQIPADWKEN